MDIANQTMKGEESSDSDIQYRYIIESDLGQNVPITLVVDAEDIIINADGVQDCPLDTVLRKNNYTFKDLKEYKSACAHFVKINKNIETVTRSISLADQLNIINL